MLEAQLEKTFTQSDFDRFARLSGDDNPIHVDPEFSAETRFGRTVAHGLLLSTILRGMLEQLLPGARLRQQSLMFPAPTFAGQPMLFSVKETSRDADSIALSFEVRRQTDDVATCTGQCRLAPTRGATE